MNNTKRLIALSLVLCLSLFAFAACKGDEELDLGSSQAESEHKAELFDGLPDKKYGGSVQWLKDSNIVNPCYNIHEPYLPLMANADEDQFKLYINDTGLLCAMYGFETKRAILENTIKGNAKGGIYENIIAETLVKNGYALYYYKPDDSNELEFLIEKNGEVVPVEVKAGNTATKSLNRFIEVYKPSAAYKIVDGNVGTSDVKLTIPHYMAMFL